MNKYSMSHLTNQVLLNNCAANVSRDHGTTAMLLAEFGEIDSRRLYVPAGYPSMHDFCIGYFRMSEDVAFKRIRAARAAAKCPAIYSLVEDGRLSLSAVVLLAPHIKAGMSDDLLVAATHKTNAQVELLLAHHFPKADLPTVLNPIAPHSGQLAVRPVEAAPAGLDFMNAPGASGPNSQLAVRPVGVTQPEPFPTPPASPAEHPASRARIKPLSPQRFALQVTIDDDVRELLREVQALLGHSIPSGDVNRVLRIALGDLAVRLRRRKFGSTLRPQAAARPRKSNERCIPAVIRREVAQRDGGQCTFVSDRGHRCASRTRLEFDHIQPVARGGLTMTTNLRLRCRAHNQYAAECVLGAGLMRDKREAARKRAVAARANGAEAGSPSAAGP